MAKAKPAISSYKNLPIGSKTQFVGWVDPKNGGFRFKRGEQSSKTWHFGCLLVAWQANNGPIVREEMYIRKMRLDGSDALRLIRQTPKGRVIQFTGRRPKDTESCQKSYWYVKIESPIEKPEKAIAIASESELRKRSRSVVVKDSVFGSLKLDPDQDCFRTKASFRGTDMFVSFETTSTDELEALLAYAKPLWKKRQAWFSLWRKSIYQYYMANLVNNWWEEDYPLTEKTFYQLLTWPVGVEFRLDEGEFKYNLGGWSDELFTDHGIDATGSSISAMEVHF